MRRTLVFDEQCLAELPEDPVEALAALLFSIDDRIAPIIDDQYTVEFESREERQLCIAVVRELLVAVVAQSESRGFTAPRAFGSTDWVHADDLELAGLLLALRREATRVLEAERIDEHARSFRAIRHGRFAYRFSGKDLARVQELINETRDAIAETEGITEEHRQRLMGKLEALQRELHRSMSNLDRFYGLLADASVLMRKVGEDAKPVVDRIGEICEIVWKVQAKAEGIAPGLLPMAAALMAENASK